MLPDSTSIIDRLEVQLCGIMKRTHAPSFTCGPPACSAVTEDVGLRNQQPACRNLFTREGVVALLGRVTPTDSVRSVSTGCK